jgi:hypothetical protein
MAPGRELDAYVKRRPIHGRVGPLFRCRAGWDAAIVADLGPAARPAA